MNDNFPNRRNTNEQRRIQPFRKSNDKGNEAFRKKKEHKNLTIEVTPEVKTVFFEVAANYQRYIEAYEQHVKNEERIVTVIENLSTELKKVLDKPAKTEPAKVRQAGGLSAKKANTHVELNESDAENDDVVALVVSLRNQNLSYEKIARHIESKGIPTLSGRGKWHSQTVQRIYQRAIS